MAQVLCFDEVPRGLNPAQLFRRELSVKDFRTFLLYVIK
jgi:hypothetical protein